MLGAPRRSGRRTAFDLEEAGPVRTTVHQAPSQPEVLTPYTAPSMQLLRTTNIKAITLHPRYHPFLWVPVMSVTIRSVR